MRVLAIGECMVELAPTDTSGDLRLGFAGDTFNTAWYLAQCAPQVDVSFLTVVGGDKISKDMTAFMRHSGIDDTFVQTSPDKSVGLYMISLDRGERSFSYWRGQSAARGLADDPIKLAQAMAVSDLIYFSGITLAILGPNRRTLLLAALRDARALGKIVAFDPNLRPKLWTSPKEMKTAIMQAASVSDIVLPSFEDEAHWFDDATPSATANRYADAGAITVVVKNGSEPVVFADGETRGEIPVVPVRELVDSTAAGDSFNAGIFAGHAMEFSLSDGIDYACSLSRAVVQEKGALVSIPLSLVASEQVV